MNKQRQRNSQLEAKDNVLVVTGCVFGASKWTTFKSKFYGPSVETDTNNPRYMLC